MTAWTSDELARIGRALATGEGCSRLPRVGAAVGLQMCGGGLGDRIEFRVLTRS